MKYQFTATIAVSGGHDPLENVLKCIYIEANFVFLHVQMLFWISAKWRLFHYFALCNSRFI